MKDSCVPTARIIGLGSYLPEKVLTNQDLEKIVDTSDEWIVSRTGIHERRIAADDEFPSDMGAIAALQAIQSAKLNPEAIDLIIVASMSPDYISPGIANLIQAKLSLKNAAAMDIQAACSGFLYALSTAKAFVEAKMYRNVLVVATEKMSAFMDYKDRSTCIIFGDGAAAAIVAGSGSGFRVGHIHLGSDGELSDLVKIPGGGSRHPATVESVEKGLHFFRMSGSELFKHAVKRMSAAAHLCLRESGITEADVAWLIPHQANKRIIEAMLGYVKIPSDRVYQTLHRYGNTSASSIGIALHELTQEHKIESKEHLLLTAVGGGLTWGAALLTYEGEEHE